MSQRDISIITQVLPPFLNHEHNVKCMCYAFAKVSVAKADTLITCEINSQSFWQVKSTTGAGDSSSEYLGNVQRMVE